jgi:hypothetical protein
VKPLVECHRCGSLHAPPVIVLDRRYFCPRCSARPSPRQVSQTLRRAREAEIRATAPSEPRKEGSPM